ncbi:MAG TPA: alanine--tRNA ligase-related protein, partial [Polyangiales bacterium]|nr:alanine--tRNA ligase-related protein [Polyangiales bacterium]
MQFNKQKDGKLLALPAPSIDTGAGLERLSCVLQNVVSNYDTDLLRPVVDLAASIAGKKYGGTLSEDDVSMRVIADHARTTAFLISEGVFPDRAERSYVLRRVMRRAIRHGHRLGIERLFLHECALLVADAMSSEYPELRERRALISDITQQEESRFRSTLKRGLDRLRDYNFSGSKVLPGPVAFELYDTYGFPLDLQEVIGKESGFEVDRAGFDTELEKARERSAGSKLGEEAVEGVYRKIAAEAGEVKFLGYDTETADSQVVGLIAGGTSVDHLNVGPGQLVTRETPFYGESGGQVGDQGVITLQGARFVVEDTLKPVTGLTVHVGKLESGSIKRGDKVHLEVD